MSDDPRNTQFAGFAALLIPEMDEVIGAVTEWAKKHDPSEKEIAREINSRWQTLIARRAYDLVAHTLYWLENDPYYRRSGEATVKDIPDLTTWPEEAK